MLRHRLRRWHNIDPALYNVACLVDQQETESDSKADCDGKIIMKSDRVKLVKHWAQNVMWKRQK